MCTVCGCGEGETTIEGHSHPHTHGHEHDGQVHSHEHSHPHDHEHGHGHEHSHDHPHEHDHSHGHDHVHGDEDLHFGLGAARAHVPGMSQSRMVQIEQDILSKNNQYADANRKHFAEHGIFVLNLVSSPGSGKTTLLTRTIQHLKGKHEVAVVEGDQQTALDADRIRATGVKAIQINTGKGCHLDAHMVGHAAERLELDDNSLLLVENVGNLVCPADFDLGEAHKVAILSVTEGEDKPLKYPAMFEAADVMLLNKIDLLPYLTFNVPLCLEYARRVNPNIKVILVSAVTGEGLDEWQEWLEQGMALAQSRKAAAVESLHRRIAELEAEVAALKGR
ncbi:MAG: hydrogenase nickel incorporation protein HypB [Sulfuricella sp.]|nr:hydrogenase nickel incorporation protein HypB [Sulfuricella sp.]